MKRFMDMFAIQTKYSVAARVVLLWMRACLASTTRQVVIPREYSTRFTYDEVISIQKKTRISAEEIYENTRSLQRILVHIYRYG
jgi:hypothetical protein